MFNNLRKINDLKYNIKKFEQAFNEQDNYINRLELVIRNQDGRIEKLHDINGKLVMQNEDLINKLKHVEKKYFKLKKRRIMITKITDKVIARIISGDIIRFGTIIDVIIYYDNETDMFISEQTKIETPTYITKHLTYIGKNKIKEHLDDLLQIGTLEWEYE